MSKLGQSALTSTEWMNWFESPWRIPLLCFITFVYLPLNLDSRLVKIRKLLFKNQQNNSVSLVRSFLYLQIISTLWALWAYYTYNTSKSVIRKLNDSVSVYGVFILFSHAYIVQKFKVNVTVHSPDAKKNDKKYIPGLCFIEHGTKERKVDI